MHKAHHVRQMCSIDLLPGRVSLEQGIDTHPIGLVMDELATNRLTLDITFELIIQVGRSVVSQIRQY